MKDKNSKAVEARDRLEKLRVFLERHYKTRISEMSRLDHGVYRATRGVERSWVVRVFPESRRPDRAKGDAEMLRFLEEKEFPAERCAVRDPVSSPAGRSVLVTEFVEGTIAEKTTEVLRKFGELIGRLSNLPLESGAISRDAGALHHYSENEGSLRNEINAGLSWLGEIEDKITLDNGHLHQSLRQKLELADDLNGLPKTLIHPDAIIKNLIQRPNGKLVLIDWTGAGRGPRIFPIAFLIWSGSLTRGGWSPRSVDSIAEGYLREVELQQDEIESFSGAMMIRQLVFAATHFRLDVNSGTQPSGNEWWWPDEALTKAISARARSAFENKSGKKPTVRSNLDD